MTTDRTAPVLTVATDPASPGEGGWWTAPVTVTAATTDDQPGPVRVEHRVGTGDWTPYTAPLSFADGERVVAFRATDAAGNTSPEQVVRVNVDTAPPVTKAERGSSAARVKLTASDATSGVARTEYRISGGRWQVHRGGEIRVKPNGRQYVEYRSIDAAGNVEAIGRYTPRRGHDDCMDDI
nr:hypothetical protein GCM10017745_37880 [Saccharothrix mutabilis subsp. capreolus]